MAENDQRNSLHYKLLADISDYMNEDVGNLPKFKAKLRNILKPADITKNKSIHEVFDAMENRGFLKAGDYRHLKSALGDNNDPIMKIVTKAEEQMGDNNGETACSSEMDVVDPEQRNKTLHTDLMAEISEYLCKELGNMAKFKTKLKAKLTPTELSSEKTFLDITRALEGRGFLGIGKYEVLKQAVEGDVEEVMKMVIETENKIKQNEKQYVRCDSDQKRKSESLVDEFSASSSKKKRLQLEADGGSDGDAIQQIQKDVNFRGENFRKHEEAALPYEEIYDLVHQNVCARIGNIHTGVSQGTGFRVGKDFILSAYHVFQPKLDSIWRGLATTISNSLDKGKIVIWLNAFFQGITVPQGFSDELQVTLEYLNKWRSSSFPPKKFTDLLEVFKDHKLHEYLKNYIESQTDLGTITFGHFKKKPGQEMISFRLSTDLPFYSVEDDVIVVRILSDPSKLMPEPFLLESTSLANKIHVIGHPDNKLLQFDPGCMVYTDTQKLQKDAKDARDYCFQMCQDVNSKKVLETDYKVMVDNFNESRCVVFHCSKSIAHGASGSPGIIMENSVPKNQVMLQRGHPETVYKALSKNQMDMLPEKCLFESGISMARLYSLMKTRETEDLRKQIFGPTEKWKEPMEH